MAKASERDRYNYGVCTNKDHDGKPCPKCGSREVQKIRKGQDFVCVECTETLRKVPPPKPPFPWKWIVIIVGLLAVLGVGGYFGYGFITNVGTTVEPPGGGDPPPPTPDGITLNKTYLEFKTIGAREQLTETVFPADVSEKNKRVIWQSGDETVATVDSVGVVRAVANGGAVVSAYLLNGISATCYVTVDDGQDNQGKEVIGDDPEETTGDVTNVGKTEYPPQPGVTFGTISIPGGTYTGDLKNGQPHGKGTIYYNSHTLIDSRDTKKRYAEAGESLTGQFKDGRLLQGEITYKNGEKEAIIIGGGAH